MTFRIPPFCSLQGNSFAMPVQLEARSIQPDAAEWTHFLDMNFTYMSESWPDKVKEEAFKLEYEQTLGNRYLQGGRGLFLHYYQQQRVGLSNAYIKEEDEVKTLNIAEFYVEPSSRGKGIASQMKNQLIAWGRKQGATQLKIEVDKGLKTANRFWQKFFALDSSGLRNVYSADI